MEERREGDGVPAPATLKSEKIKEIVQLRNIYLNTT